jgi:hypothetical protein
MKMVVAPVFAMAWFVAIVRAFKYYSKGLPNRASAVDATIVIGAFKCFIQLDITIVIIYIRQRVECGGVQKT